MINDDEYTNNYDTYNHGMMMDYHQNMDSDEQ